MIKHVILWKLSEELDGAEKENVKKNIKTELESLKSKIEGLVDITVRTESLSSSNADLMLDSVFENEESLKAYQKNELHVNVANTFVRPFTIRRLCLDFEI